MPASDPSDPKPPQQQKPARRDPRLDAKSPSAGQSPVAAKASPPKPIPAASSTELGLTSSRRLAVWIGSGAGAALVLALAGWAFFFNQNSAKAPSTPAAT